MAGSSVHVTCPSCNSINRIPPWLSDTMCRISTGSGISDRVLCTNDEEVIYFLKRPQIFTAIPEAAVRGDLVSRLISLTLPALPKFERRTEGIRGRGRQGSARCIGCAARCRGERPAAQRRDPAGAIAAHGRPRDVDLARRPRP